MSDEMRVMHAEGAEELCERKDNMRGKLLIFSASGFLMDADYVKFRSFSVNFLNRLYMFYKYL